MQERSVIPDIFFGNLSGTENPYKSIFLGQTREVTPFFWLRLARKLIRDQEEHPEQFDPDDLHKNRLLVMYLEKAPWSQVKQEIRLVHSTARRTHMYAAYTARWLGLGLLDEAKETASLWQAAAIQAFEGSDLDYKGYIYRLYWASCDRGSGVTVQYPYEGEEPAVPPIPRQEQIAPDAIAKSLRQSIIAASLIDWVLEHGGAQLIEKAEYQPLKKLAASPIPTIRFFDYALSQALGMPRQTYRQIAQKANKLNIESYRRSSEASSQP